MYRHFFSFSFHHHWYVNGFKRSEGKISGMHSETLSRNECELELETIVIVREREKKSNENTNEYFFVIL